MQWQWCAARSLQGPEGGCNKSNVPSTGIVHSPSHFPASTAHLCMSKSVITLRLRPAAQWMFIGRMRSPPGLYPTNLLLQLLQVLYGKKVVKAEDMTAMIEELESYGSRGKLSGLCDPRFSNGV